MNSRPVILQVEDHEEDVYLLGRALRHAGVDVNVQVAPDGRAAIDYLGGHGQYADRARYPFPYLVLLDLKLPQLTGLEVLAWIRNQRLSSVVVIVLSSSIHDDDVKRAYELGANAFLVKPSDVNTLTDMCKAVKHFWLTYNQPPAVPLQQENAG